MLPRTQPTADVPAPVNLFIAGLPLRCSVSEIRAILSHITVETVESHGSFAFLRVPQEQVTEACEKYDGVRLQEKFLHVSRSRQHPVGCRKCWQFGHRVEECTLSLGDVQNVPQTMSTQRIVASPTRQHDCLKKPLPQPSPEQRLNSPPQPSPEQRLKSPPQPSPEQRLKSPPQPSPEQRFNSPPQLSPEQRMKSPPQPSPEQSPPQPTTEQRLKSPPQPSPERLQGTPPRSQQASPSSLEANHFSAAATSSILFAKAWAGEVESDEWPCAEASRQEPLPELPQKRKQGEEARAEESTWKLAQTFVARASMTKSEQSKELVRQLRESGSAPCGDAEFLLEKQRGAVNLCSRVTCAKCQASIMVKSVLAHLMSKSHQAAAQS